MAKYNHVSIKSEITSQIDDIKDQCHYSSRASVVEEAVRRMHRKEVKV